VRIEQAVSGLSRAIRIALICNIVLLVLLVISWSVNLSIPRKSVTDLAMKGLDRNVQFTNTSIEAESVDRAIRGKAVLRTARAVEEKIVDELGRYQLMGVSIGSNGAKAFIKDTARKQMLTVSSGETLGVQFEVESIDQEGVVLRRGGETLRLKR